MSDTQRTFSSSGRPITFGASAPRRRRFPWWFLILLVAAVFAAAWLSRDTYEMDAFVSKDAPYRVTVLQAMDERRRWADSPVWDALPESSDLISYRDTLQDDLPLPEWLAKNILDSRLYVVASTVGETPVFVSRMTRTGTLAARAGRWLPGVEIESAGGLNLRAMEDGGYFAVRGRVLIASASRRAIVEALTLAFADSVIATGIATPRDADGAPVFGEFVIPESAREHYGIDRMRFSVHLDGAQLRVVARGIVSESATGIGGLVARAQPDGLEQPYSARAALAVDLGENLETTSRRIADVFGAGEDVANQWRAWKFDGDDESTRAIWVALAGLGPELHLTVHDVDLNEALPVPEIVLASPGGGEGFEDALRALPVPSDGLGIDTVHASYDPARRYLHVPFVGGDSLEPSAAWHGDRLVVSTSQRKLAGLLEEAPETRAVSGPYVAYLNAKPPAIVELMTEIGELLASESLLEGYDSVEEFRTAAETWRARAMSFSDIEAGLRLDGDEAVLECRVGFAP